MLDGKYCPVCYTYHPPAYLLTKNMEFSGEVRRMVHSRKKNTLERATGQGA